MKKVILFFGLLIVCSCTLKQVNKGDNENKAVDTNTASVIRSQSVKAKQNACKTRIIDDRIIYNLLSIKTFTVDSSSIISLFIKPPKVNNKKCIGVDGYSYEKIIFETEQSNLCFLKNDGGYYLIEGKIGANDIYLINKCYVGMIRNDFYSSLKVKSVNCDTLQVVNQDQTYEYEFIFDNADRLSKVLIYSEE